MTSEADTPPVRVFHERSGGDGIHAMLQPSGVNYNGDLRSLRRGSRIEFWGGEVGIVVDVCEVPMQLPIFQVLCRWIYGEKVSRSCVIDRWREHAVMVGNGEGAVSVRKCLLIRYINEREES